MSASGGRHVGVREVERDSVVRPERLHVEVERVAEPRAQRHRPGRVHAPAERREDAHAPVADLVAKALDHHGRVRRDDTGRRLLLAKEGDEVAGSERIEPVLALDALDRSVVGECGELARRAPDPLTELGGASDSLALPERSDAGHAGSRRDENAVARDLLDAPGRRSEHERLALARLVDHLLVELAHAPAPVDEEDTEEAAVRDRPGVRDCEAPRAGAPTHRAGGPIPHDPRPQLRELVGRVAAREHVEDVLELRT